MTLNTVYIIFLFIFALAACNKIAEKKSFVEIEVEYSEDYDQYFDHFPEMFEDPVEEENKNIKEKDSEQTESQENDEEYEEEYDEEYASIGQMIPSNVKNSCDADNNFSHKNYNILIKSLCNYFSNYSIY